MRTIALRFSNKFAPDCGTIEAHNEMIREKGYVWYGKLGNKIAIYMPLLVIDSANQPMGVDSFEKVYHVFVKMAEKVGIQTIFMSKDKINAVKPEDFIDISNGLNKFHKA